VAFVRACAGCLPQNGARSSLSRIGTGLEEIPDVSAFAVRHISAPEKLPPFTDKYDVERVIGRGGMGTVFEARHHRLGQRVAIKVLGEDLRMYPELVRRFEREARAASALSSPHAVRVFDIDQTEDGTPFFVMEMLEGRDLGNIVHDEGPQSVGLAVRWIIEACDAIAEAHRLGIVHRDIKPANLLLCENGSIKVLDFGIAKHSSPNERAITIGLQPLGTPQYMSPEQVRCAKDVDARTDIWSLGVTLYELVVGRPPYNQDLSAACIAAIAADPVPDPRQFKPDLPAAVAAILMRALEKDPKKRFQTVDEMVLALASHGEAITPETPSWRVISTMRKAFAKNEATLDGIGEAPIESEVRRLALVDDDETVPPVAHVSIPMVDGRRMRGAVAVGAAVLFGLAALVLTPRWITPPAPKPAAAALVPVERPTAKEIVNAPEPPPTIELAATPPPPPVASTPKPRPSATHTTVRFVGEGRLVHGGISNPGF
jgi:serine/threonine-protein kinase